MLRRISSSLWVRMPALETVAPALLMSTVTSGRGIHHRTD